MKTTALVTFFLALLACLGGAAASAADYYVDSGKGNDANAGHSPQTPWRTLGALNRTGFKPGDRILLAAGSRFTGQLAPRGSGNKDAAITLDERNRVDRGRKRCKYAAAGIWPLASDNTVIQNNEVSGIKGTFDGLAFDSDDNCRNTLIQFRKNVYYGNHIQPPADAEAITADPLLASAGSGGTGFDTLNGYKLKAGSPCIGAAIPISPNGGLDFWRNPVPPEGPTCIGTHELTTAGNVRRGPDQKQPPALKSGLARGSDPIRVSDAFESGSLGKWRVEDETHLFIAPRIEYDREHVNSALTWFYGRLSNVLNREVTIQIEGLEYTVYNGQQGEILPFERNTVPVYSYDGEVWERFIDCSFHKETRTFRIRHIFSRDAVWIAYIPPYTFSRLEALLAEMRKRESVAVESIGRSVEGRPLYLVTVVEPGTTGDDRPVVWVAARQHAFEAGGSWAIEGLLSFLAGPDSEAQAIRKRVIFKICPMLNPDGVVHGGTRFNASGVDLNRHWHEEDPLSRDSKAAPEISLMKKAVRDWRATRRLDLWINIHNNDMVWNDDGDYIRFAPAAKTADARRLEALLRRETTFTGPFEPAPTPQATEAVVASETGAIGLLMEMKTGYLEEAGRWTGTDIFLSHGRGLARAVSSFFDK